MMEAREMPIEVEGGPLRSFSQEDFYELDQVVMGITFRVHNEFGRFFDELVYKREIEARCLQAGIPTERELRIWVRHGSFEKVFRADLVFSRGVIFEVKTVESLCAAHEAQALNYLMLTGVHHGKLVNLRPERVRWRFVSTQLTPMSRRRITIEDSVWRLVNSRSRILKHRLAELLHDWGAFLECNLYREALNHSSDGEAVVVRRIPVLAGGRMIGEQAVHMVDDDTAFALTSITKPTEGMRLHLERFLAHTPLRHVQRVNLNRHRIEFVTLSQ